MIDPDRIPWLIERAKALGHKLAEFRTRDSAEPVDPSRLLEAKRFLDVTRSVEGLETWRRLLPRSYHIAVSKSAKPQLDAVATALEGLIRELRARPPKSEAQTVEELQYVIGWAARIMHMRERGTATESGPPRGGYAGPRPSQGGPRSGWYGGRR